MKTIFNIVLIVVLVLLFGTFPLTILSKVFDFIGNILNALANFLNIFGFNGLL